MTESLLEELPQHSSCEEDKAAGTPDSAAAPPEYSFLAALPIVHRILARRRSRLDPANRSDLAQEVALRIWKWRAKNQDKTEQMSGHDWNSFAARTTYNEVNRKLSRDGRPANVPLEAVPEIQQQSLEGETEVEVFSLIQQVWQAYCKLSLRQRKSLLLHSQELVIYFLQIGITESDLAESLDFNEAVWYAVRDRLPMTDFEIAEITNVKAGSIKKARYEARAKLDGLIRR